MKKTKEKIILITGATGFVGYNACEYYRKKGWKVFGLSSSAGKLPTGVKLVKVDLLDYEKLNFEIKKIKPIVVLHLGAHVVLDRNFKTAQKCIDVNIKGTLNLLETLKSHSVKKMLFFSTEEVYGLNKVPYKENQLLLPPSPYAISKVAAENLCLMYHQLHKLPVVVMRIATTFGYHQPKSRFIPTIILKAIKNEPILLNSGKNKRDYLFIESLLDAINKAILFKRVEGEVLNIGHTKSISGEALAKKVVVLSGSESKIILNAFPDREGEASKWGMNEDKTKKLLKWKNEISIDEGLSLIHI